MKDSKNYKTYFNKIIKKSVYILLDKIKKNKIIIF